MKYNLNDNLILKLFLENNKMYHFYPIIRNNTDISLAIPLINNKDIVPKDNYIFNPDSKFYNDPCYSLTIKNQQISINLRREMFKYDLTICPKEECSFIKYFNENKLVQCECNDTKSFHQNNYKFKKNVKDKNSNPFKCYKFLNHFFQIKSFLHFIPLINIIYIIIMIIIFYKSNIKYLYNEYSISNPIKRIKYYQKEEESGTNSVLRHYSNSTNSHNFSKKYMKKNTNSIKIYKKSYQEILSLQRLIGMNYENDIMNKNFKFLILPFIKQKLFIISTFTSYNIFYPYTIRNCVHFFIFTFYLFLNSFLYKEDINDQRQFIINYNKSKIQNKKIFINSKDIKRSFISFAIGYLIFVLINYLFYNYNFMNQNNDKYNINEIIEKIKKKSIIIFCVFIIFEILFWYYILNKGFLLVNKQLSILILSIICVLMTFIFQILFIFLSGIMRYYAVKRKNLFIYKVGKIFYYLT